MFRCDNFCISRFFSVANLSPLSPPISATISALSASVVVLSEKSAIKSSVLESKVSSLLESKFFSEINLITLIPRSSFCPSFDTNFFFNSIALLTSSPLSEPRLANASASSELRLRMSSALTTLPDSSKSSLEVLRLSPTSTEVES